MLILVGLARAAHAEPSLSSEMQFHFEGERDEGIAWMGFGSASLVGGGALLEGGSRFERGLSYPLLGFGAIEGLEEPKVQTYFDHALLASPS